MQRFQEMKNINLEHAQSKKRIFMNLSNTDFRKGGIPFKRSLIDKNLYSTVIT